MTRPIRWLAVAAATLLLSLAGADGLAAQDRYDDGDWWRWALAEVLTGEDLRFERDRRLRARHRGFERGARARGPAFCRSGAGHPVFGRSWCVRKGFGLGHDRWRRSDLGDVLFGRTPLRDGAVLDRAGLEELLGAVVLGRLLEGTPLDARDRRVTGRWLERRGARVLQLRAGGRPVAELSDLDRDDVVDVLLRAVDD